MKLELNDKEIGALVAVLDLALKAGGLQASPAVNLIFGKLEAAKRDEADLTANPDSDAAQ
jgi:hypothetical protein